MPMIATTIISSISVNPLCSNLMSHPPAPGRSDSRLEQDACHIARRRGRPNAGTSPSLEDCSERRSRSENGVLRHSSGMGPGALRRRQAKKNPSREGFFPNLQPEGSGRGL